MDDFIIREVERLKKKHGTINPYEIAKGENIIIIKEPLGSIHGYYNKYVRQKFIHINSNLDEMQQYVTCGHELGHARMHSNANTPFFRTNTFYSINKLERQANKFDAYLLYDPEKIDSHVFQNSSLEEIALIQNLPLELIKIRFNVF